MSKRRTAVFFAFAWLVAAASPSVEIWVVQVDTPFPYVVPPCQDLARWETNLLVHNPTSEPIDVSLLDVSNGARNPAASPLRVSPGTTASVRGLDPAGLNWAPVAPVEFTPMWVNKLEVPSPAVVANRVESVILEMLTTDPNPPCSDSRTLFSAGIPMRVFTELVPAGVAQYHLGTDIGNFGLFFRVDSRINVGVYNDSAERASVAIEVRCSSEGGSDAQPDPVVATMTLQVPPHSLTQTRVIDSTVTDACPLFGPAPYHVVVTSNQPGFSYVSAISNEGPARFPVGTSITF